MYLETNIYNTLTTPVVDFMRYLFTEELFSVILASVCPLETNYVEHLTIYIYDKVNYTNFFLCN